MRAPHRIVQLTVAAVVLVLGGVAAPAHADGYIENGTDNPVAARPAPTRPATKHCTVTLADHFLSNGPDGAPRSFQGTVTPPAACPGPWAKVLMDYDVSVSGRQFDRSASITIGGAAVYVGTTQEPSGPVPISYRVTKDLTRYSALLRRPQPFVGGIGNYMDATYTGNYDQSVTLTYYQADKRNPAPEVPDEVRAVPLADLTPGASSASVQLSDLPRNLTGASLEVTLKGNGCDEQWFSTVPDQTAANFPGDGVCAHGPFREAVFGVDGATVGGVGTYPHVYSGGITPTLWRPVLAIDTLDLRPEYLDLTPYVGGLVDGASHTVNVSMDPIGDRWNVWATLLLDTDKGSAQTSGRTVSSAVAPHATVTTTASGTDPATYRQHATRHDTAYGYVDTSKGRVYTRTTNDRNYLTSGRLSDHGLKQQLDQVDAISTASTSTLGHRTIASKLLDERYPIRVDYDAGSYVDDQNFAIEGTVHMGQEVRSRTRGATGAPLRASWDTTVDSYGILARANGVTSQSDGHSTTSFTGTDDAGRHHHRTITTEHGRVVSDRGR